MKGMMLNEHVGLLTATLKREKTRTSRKEKFCEQAEKDMRMGFVKQKYLNNEIHLFTKEETAAVSYKTRYLKHEIVAIKQSYKTIWENMPSGIEKHAFKKKYEHTSGWTNKMFVKNDVMPHQIIITDIKLDYVRWISDEDCIKEGIYKHEYLGRYLYSFHGEEWNYETPRMAFSFLIDLICGKAFWMRNDLYVVYYYKLVK